MVVYGGPMPIGGRGLAIARRLGGSDGQGLAMVLWEGRGEPWGPYRQRVWVAGWQR
jgi:hypothetical protein